MINEGSRFIYASVIDDVQYADNIINLVAIMCEVSSKLNKWWLFVVIVSEY